MRTRAIHHPALWHPLLWTVLACLGFVAQPAYAQATDEAAPPLSVSGVCPKATSVQSVLKTLLPSERLRDADAASTVSDLGDAYVVTVGERAKRYSDPIHDCSERARIAAAFIALALDAQAPPSGGSAPANTAANTAATPPPRSQWLVRVDARGALQVAPQDGLVAPGVALRFAARSGMLGVSAMCGWLAPTSLSLPGEKSGTALLERFPCSVGPMLRFGAAADRLELNLEGGAALGALVVNGQGFAANNDSARFELGARLAFDAALHFDPQGTGLSPVIGLEATYFPAPYDLDVNPRGAVSKAPSVWAGLTVGLCWSAL